MSELVAVTGAEGWVGGEVCRWLEGAGIGVRRLSRRAPDTRLAVDLITSGIGDWSAALNGCSAVVHCAAHVHRAEETEPELQLFLDTNVRGMERLLAACTATGIERIVFASTLAVYGGTRVSPWDEDALLLPVTAYGRSKAEGEAMVRGSGLCWRIARLGTVFGTGDRANFMRLASALRRRRFVLPGKGSARKSVLPVGRAGEVLGRLALLTEKRGILVNCAMPVAPSLAEICAAFGEACGFPSPPRVPVSLLKIAGRMGDLVGTRAPLNSSVLRKLTVDTVVHVERMQSLLPDLEWSDFPAALVPAVEYYRSCGR